MADDEPAAVDCPREPPRLLHPTPFVLMDLPFAVDGEAVHRLQGDACSYPAGRSSPLVDLFGGADALQKATLDADPRRVSDLHLKGSSNIRQMQPIEMRLYQPAPAPSALAATQPYAAVSHPVLRGEVGVCEDVILRIRRTVRRRKPGHSAFRAETAQDGRCGKIRVAHPERVISEKVDVVGCASRYVHFHTPGDPCFLPAKDAIGVGKEDAVDDAPEVLVQPNVTGAPTRPLFRRSDVPPPQAIGNMTLAESVPYHFRNVEMAPGLAVKSMDIRSSDPIPREFAPATMTFLRERYSVATDVIASLLKEQPLWQADELVHTAHARAGVTKFIADSCIRGLTFRVMDGCLSRLRCAIGFDFRLRAHRSLVCQQQRVALRTPHIHRRYVASVVSMPDLGSALDAIEQEVQQQDGKHTEAQRASATFFVSLFRGAAKSSGLSFMLLSASAISTASAEAAEALRGGLQDRGFDAKRGWYSETALQHASSLFHAALYSFATEEIAPRLRTAAVGSAAPAPVIDPPRILDTSDPKADFDHVLLEEYANADGVSEDDEGEEIVSDDEDSNELDDWDPDAGI